MCLGGGKMPRAKRVKAKLTPELMAYVEKCASNTTIAPELYVKYDVKRGLRDVDGKGVVADLLKFPRYRASKLTKTAKEFNVRAFFSTVELT